MIKRIVLWLWGYAPILIVATLALSAWLWLEFKHPLSIQTSTTAKTKVNHEISDLKLLIATGDDHRHMVLKAPKAQRLKDNGAMSIQNADLTVHEVGQPVVQVSSRLAQLSADQSTLSLSKGVWFKRAPGEIRELKKTLPGLELQTDQMVVKTREKNYIIPSKILVQTSDSHLSADQGHYDANSGEVKLMGRVRGTLGGDIASVWHQKSLVQESDAQ